MAPALMKGLRGNAAFAFELHDGVEGRARGLAADASPQPVASLAQRQGERKNLRDALDREWRVAIAARGGATLRVDHDETEVRGIDPRELRYVVGDRSAILTGAQDVNDFVDDGLEESTHAEAPKQPLSQRVMPDGSKSRAGIQRF